MSGFLDQSILNSIKKALSLPAEIEDFDEEITMFINSAFATLHQLGVGPLGGFSISGPDNLWGEFETRASYNDIKSYVYLKVRIIFDPPTITVLSNSFEKQIQELEWRLNVKREEELWEDWRLPRNTILEH